MKRAEWLVRATLVLCLVYAVVATQSRNDETFPFFSWDLFSRVPSPRSQDYSVRIVEADGLNKPSPVYFEDADLLSAGREIQGYTALQRLGESFEAGHAFEAAFFRERFESSYLSSLKNVRYELVRRSFDIRERVECRTCFTDVTVLGTYTVD